MQCCSQLSSTAGQLSSGCSAAGGATSRAGWQRWQWPKRAHHSIRSCRVRSAAAAAAAAAAISWHASSEAAAHRCLHSAQTAGPVAASAAASQECTRGQCAAGLMAAAGVRPAAAHPSLQACCWRHHITTATAGHQQPGTGPAALQQAAAGTSQPRTSCHEFGGCINQVVARCALLQGKFKLHGLGWCQVCCLWCITCLNLSSLPKIPLP
ncbi:hypothetical protein COO60DRAFT_1499810 [Scenedesmus sp. NREL 46B-D3]|nr:hypothetical protein COO60DRAFT_1499810 [Scenedesmus sp. NREL 46B-D3]